MEYIYLLIVFVPFVPVGVNVIEFHVVVELTLATTGKIYTSVVMAS